jgi:hypothetical protein
MSVSPISPPTPCTYPSRREVMFKLMPLLTWLSQIDGPNSPTVCRIQSLWDKKPLIQYRANKYSYGSVLMTIQKTVFYAL